VAMTVSSPSGESSPTTAGTRLYHGLLDILDIHTGLHHLSSQGFYFSVESVL